MHTLSALGVGVLIATMGAGPGHEARAPLYMYSCPLNGNLYALTPGAMSWSEARAWARSYGGELVQIRNEAENEWVFRTFTGSASEPRNLWIGLSDRHEEGVFRWNRADPVGFSAWARHEPNDFGGEDYAHIWCVSDPNAGRWNDFIDSAEGPGGVPMYGVMEIIPRRCRER